MSIAGIVLVIGLYLLFIFFVLLILDTINFLWGWKYIKSNSESLKQEGCTAIILVEKRRFFIDRFPIYSSGIPWLIMYLKNNGKPFKVYKWVDKDTFKRIICDEKVKEAYIFGHGVRHGIKFNMKEIFYYCNFEEEFKTLPKKDYIAQLHCNRLGGKSLVEIAAKDGFVTNSYRWVYQNWAYCYEKYGGFGCKIVSFILRANK